MMKSNIEIKTFVSKEYYVKLIDMTNIQILEKKAEIKKELEESLQEANMIATNDINITLSPFPINVAINKYSNKNNSYLAYGLYGKVEGISCNKDCKECDNRYICITKYSIKKNILKQKEL